MKEGSIYKRPRLQSRIRKVKYILSITGYGGVT